MKKHMLIVMLAFLAMPVFADVSPGYNPVAMTALAAMSAPVAVDAVAVDAVAVDAVGNTTAVEAVEVQVANCSNTKTYAEKAKTGVGMLNTAGLVGGSRTGPSHRQPLHEWAGEGMREA